MSGVYYSTTGTINFVYILHYLYSVSACNTIFFYFISENQFKKKKNLLLLSIIINSIMCMEQYKHILSDYTMLSIIFVIIKIN